MRQSHSPTVTSGCCQRRRRLSDVGSAGSDRISSLYMLSSFCVNNGATSSSTRAAYRRSFCEIASSSMSCGLSIIPPVKVIVPKDGYPAQLPDRLFFGSNAPIYILLNTNGVIKSKNRTLCWIRLNFF